MQFSCVIPAYNEQDNIGRIIQSCLHCDLLDEIIIINDGSTDNTSIIIDSFSDNRLVKVHLPNNRGKLEAFFQGIAQAKGVYIFMVDADYDGFETKHIHELIMPIINKEVDVTMMMWHESWILCKWLKHDIFSGTRVLPKWVFDDKEYFLTGRGFALETRINEVIYTKKLRVKSFYFPEVHNPSKGWKQIFWNQPRDILRASSPLRILRHSWYIYRQQTTRK